MISRTKKVLAGTAIALSLAFGAAGKSSANTFIDEASKGLQYVPPSATLTTCTGTVLGHEISEALESQQTTPCDKATLYTHLFILEVVEGLGNPGNVLNLLVKHKREISIAATYVFAGISTLAGELCDFRELDSVDVGVIFGHYVQTKVVETVLEITGDLRHDPRDARNFYIKAITDEIMRHAETPNQETRMCVQTVTTVIFNKFNEGFERSVMGDF